MEGIWPIIFLGVILKLPVVYALWLVWWAVRAEPKPEQAADGDDGGFRRRPRIPRRPSGPRRGPHAPDARPLPDCPPGGRFRVIKRPARERVRVS